MKGRETNDEYRARMNRFKEAKAAFEFYDTGLGRVLPDRDQKRLEANRAMWENAHAPALDDDEEESDEEREECPTCEGSGYDPEGGDENEDGEHDDTCPDCGGDGVI